MSGKELTSPERLLAGESHSIDFCREVGRRFSLSERYFHVVQEEKQASIHNFSEQRRQISGRMNDKPTNNGSKNEKKRASSYRSRSIFFSFFFSL